MKVISLKQLKYSGKWFQNMQISGETVGIPQAQPPYLIRDYFVTPSRNVELIAIAF